MASNTNQLGPTSLLGWDALLCSKSEDFWEAIFNQMQIWVAQAKSSRIKVCAVSYGSD